ncbi:MAG: hypothetical protein M9916_07540 [Crocinitomicaceae bacterium]|nr:hypothetical protein [Crocinitomicaceae bacterium]
MKTKFTLLFSMFVATFSYSQTFYKVEVAAEGNFGTPNGDLFYISNSSGGNVATTGLYQTANNTTGFDVLQDYAVFGNKIVLGEKPSGSGRLVVANYPDLTTIHTFTVSGV